MYKLCSNSNVNDKGEVSPKQPDISYCLFPNIHHVLLFLNLFEGKLETQIQLNAYSWTSTTFSSF